MLILCLLKRSYVPFALKRLFRFNLGFFQFSKILAFSKSTKEINTFQFLLEVRKFFGILDFFQLSENYTSIPWTEFRFKFFNSFSEKFSPKFVFCFAIWASKTRNICVFFLRTSCCVRCVVSRVTSGLKNMVELLLNFENSIALKRPTKLFPSRPQITFHAPLGGLFSSKYFSLITWHRKKGSPLLTNIKQVTFSKRNLDLVSFETTGWFPSINASISFPHHVKRCLVESYMGFECFDGNPSDRK